MTHLHVDHAGGASKIKEQTKSEILYHENELKALKYALQAGDWLPNIFDVGDMAAFNMALGFIRNLPEPDHAISDQTSIGRWKVIHTPGHTPGHIILTDGSTAITGDLILMDDTSNIAYVPLTGYHPLSSYLESVVYVASLKVDLFLPSHGEVFTECRQRISEIFSHHYQRLSQTAQALAQGDTTPSLIAERISWSSGKFATLKPLEKWLAILETISHLDFLVETGYAVNKSALSYQLSETADWGTVKTRLTEISQNMWKA
ncbi:MAG: MBL fold metallo-hydrolase [Candidatus Caldarchaeum sp.]|nr:MBL fold metallo-hydrolase [Candidatus Caldarchaeum sp.]